MAPSELTPYNDRTVGDRYDARIDPDASHWIAVRDQFQELLDDQDSTLDSILTRYFSPQDRELLMPATSPHYLVAMQQDNTKRYHQLISLRFPSERPGIALKLALAYFGHPVEPVHVELFRVIDEDIAMVDCVDLAPHSTNPPLHFLTAHDERNWGIESMKGKQGLFYSPHPPPGHLSVIVLWDMQDLSGRLVGLSPFLRHC